MRIRQYTENDFERLCVIHDAARMNELKASGLESAFVPLKVAAYEENLFEYELGVLEIDDIVVGFVAYLEHELAWLYVDPLYGKRGIGRALVDYVKNVYLGEVIHLEVISNNKPALEFYEKQGFSISKTMRGPMPGNESFVIEVYEMSYGKNIESLSEMTDKDEQEVVAVWESAVVATHHFLSEKDIETIRPQVLEGAKAVEDFRVIRNDEHKIIAFLGVHQKKVEMLFVDDAYRGQGLGKLLLEYAIKKLNVTLVDVNEDNEQGLGFYLHMGFVQMGRSETDEAENPFPIIHMGLETE